MPGPEAVSLCGWSGFAYACWEMVDAMDAVIVVDMQVGILSGPAKHDLAGVVNRINQLTDMPRRQKGRVIWVQHCGDAGDDFAPGAPGWAFLPELVRREADLVVRKTLNDAFAGTELKEVLDAIAPDRVLITGWATEFCVDATVRSTVSNGYNVVVVSDGHTSSDRPHLDAPMAARHHNWIWANLITRRSILVAPASELLDAKG